MGIFSTLRFSFYDGMLMEALCRQALKKVDTFSAQDVANTLNGQVCSFFSDSTSGTFWFFTAFVVVDLSFLVHDEISCAVFICRLQRLNHFDSKVLLALQVHCRKVAPAMRPQHISNTLQSAAHFQISDDLSIKSVLREIVSAVHDLCRSSDPMKGRQAVVFFDSERRKLKLLHKARLSSKLCSQPAKIDSFSPQEVATCCSAVAGLKSSVRNYLDACGTLWLLVESSN